jgi:hypothetical protein
VPAFSATATAAAAVDKRTIASAATAESLLRSQLWAAAQQQQQQSVSAASQQQSAAAAAAAVAAAGSHFSLDASSSSITAARAATTAARSGTADLTDHAHLQSEVLRLLVCMRTLGEENGQLLRECEEGRRAFAAAAAAREDMAQFKQAYAKRFQGLRKVRTRTKRISKRLCSDCVCSNAALQVNIVVCCYRKGWDFYSAIFLFARNLCRSAAVK